MSDLREARRRAAASRAVGEDGYTIIAVLILLVIGLAVVSAALSTALSSSYSATHNARLQRAQQAADAGIQAQLYTATQADLGSSTYNFNGGPLGLGAFLDCTVPQLNASLQITGVVNVAADSAGVCPQAQSSGGQPTTLNQPVGEHSSYQSEMITGQTNFLNGRTIGSQNGSAMRELFPRIVSIGKETTTTAGNSAPVYSREEAILAPIAPLQAIEGENNVTIGGLSLLGVPLASTLNGDVLAQGNLTTPSLALAGLNLSNGLLATLAYGGSYSGGLSVANVQHVSASSLPPRQPVSIAASKPDCSSAANCTALGSAYNATYDTFSLSSGSVTFGPGDYVFCSFYAAGGTTINVSPSSSTPVRIFIDSPSSSRCAADKAHGDSNLGSFDDVAGFSNGLLGTGGVLGSSGFQVYVAGNGTGGGTSVQIGPTSTSGLLSLSALTYGAIVYAPMSDLTANVPAACVLSICTGGVLEGSFVGYNTTVNALTITQDLDIGNYPLYAGVNAFRVTQYIQCDNSVSSLTGQTSDENGC
jgi:Tfp pilus assembly protein PilX